MKLNFACMKLNFVCVKLNFACMKLNFVCVKLNFICLKSTCKRYSIFYSHLKKFNELPHLFIGSPYVSFISLPYEVSVEFFVFNYLIHQITYPTINSANRAVYRSFDLRRDSNIAKKMT